MFLERELNNWRNGLHDRALKITHQNRILSFHKLVDIDKSVFINHRNVHYLLIKIYKVKMGLPSPIMEDIIFLDQNAS